MTKVIKISNVQLGVLLLTTLDKLNIKVINPSFGGNRNSVFITNDNKGLIIPTASLATTTEKLEIINDIDFISQYIKPETTKTFSVITNTKKNVLKIAIEQSGMSVYDIATITKVNAAYLNSLANGTIKTSNKNLKSKADLIKIVCK